MTDTDDPGALLDRLEEARKAAAVVGLLSDEEHRARVEAEWAVLQGFPEVLRLARDGLALRAELTEAHRKILALKIEVTRLGGPDDLDRLRAVVADTSGEGQ